MGRLLPRAVVLVLGRALPPTAAVYKALIAGTFNASVTVDEPGTITQTLAAGKTVVGSASKRATTAGTVVLKLKLSASGRRPLSSSRSAKLTLTTRLRDAAGNARTLAPSHFTATRAAR
jgi:hypothetical protein